MQKNTKNRKLEISIGLLFIVATLSYGIGNSLVNKGTLDGVRTSMAIIGMGLELINSLSVIGIGILSFVLLKGYNQKMIKGYIFTRGIEGIVLAIGSISILFISHSNIDDILRFKEYTFAYAMLALGLFSIVYFTYLLKENLAPKLLLLLGVVGYISLSMYAIIFILKGSASMIFFAPGGIFEILLPLYLMIKGYKEK